MERYSIKEWLKNCIEINFNDDDNQIEVEAIRDSAEFAKKLDAGHLSHLYYLILWKDFPKKKNTFESVALV